MRGKFRLVYLDVMAGPGRCIEEDTGDEFAGSPFVALDFEFSDYIFIEADQKLNAALEQRLSGHPKSDKIKVINGDWSRLARKGDFVFDASTLVVAFIDPTGIAAVPMNAMCQLMKNPRIDLLVTIQHRLGVTWNVPQYLQSQPGTSAISKFLGHEDWRSWETHDASAFARKAIDDFCRQIHDKGFQEARHVSVPERNPLYRFAYFSRHSRGGDFWDKILKIDDKGQRELQF